MTGTSYSVEWDEAALKELERLDRPTSRRVIKHIESLSTKPIPSGARPLNGYPGLWRIRVGNYRVVYAIEDGRLVVLILVVGHRREVYEHMRRRLR